MQATEKKPLRSREAMTMQFLFGLIQIMQDADELCHDRLSVCGKLRDFRRCKTQLGNIANAMMETVPDEKLRTFDYNLAHQEMSIRTKSDGLCKAEGFTYVPTESLLTLCAMAAKFRCEMCDGTGEEMRKCNFRKCMDNSCLIEFDNGLKTAQCKWCGFNWEGVGDE